MTNQEAIDNGRFDDAFAVVEALLDGERVDADRLKDALADPAAREHFVDLIALREAVVRWAQAWEGDPAHARRPVRWFAAAAAIVVSLGAGYLAGQRAIASGGPPSSAVEATIQLERPPAAPRPRT